jgi:hypothetical protein
MKRFARMLWAAGVLGGLLTGVQTLTAAPPGPDPENCVFCYQMEEGGPWLCYDMACGEP